MINKKGKQQKNGRLLNWWVCWTKGPIQWRSRLFLLKENRHLNDLYSCLLIIVYDFFSTQMNWVNKWKTHKNQTVGSPNQTEYSMWLIFCLTEFSIEIVFICDFDIFTNQLHTNTNESMHSVHSTVKISSVKFRDLWYLRVQRNTLSTKL